MGILGYFFKLSYVMKDYHKILTEDYKFSTWVSYAFFTAATILVGGLLGLVSNMIILLQTRAFTFRVPSRTLISRTALQAGFISSKALNICKKFRLKSYPSKWPSWQRLFYYKQVPSLLEFPAGIWFLEQLWRQASFLARNIIFLTV